jgi:cold shock CspA family protein
MVAERGVLGKVKWFSLRRGFGFGVRDDAKDENDEFFVHRVSAVSNALLD